MSATSNTQEKKKDMISKYRAHDKDTGSAQVQVALLTDRINSLSGHFKAHAKDHHSRMGLLQMIGKRRKLLEYIKKNNMEKYQELITKLGIRK